MKDIELNMFITLLRQLVRELRIMQDIDIIMTKLYCAAGDFFFGFKSQSGHFNTSAMPNPL